MKAAEFGVELDDRAAAELSERLKELEAEGFVFEAADASLELLMRRAARLGTGVLLGARPTGCPRYHREGAASLDRCEVDLSTEATVKLWVGDDRLASVGEGNGPGQRARRRAARGAPDRYPALAGIHLTDFRVRVLDGPTSGPPTPGPWSGC